MNLPIFPAAPTLSAAELTFCLVSSRVRRVIHFALGPAGTNIAQACESWTQETGIQDKAEVVLCSTPEDSLAKARLVTDEGVLPLFWTCAVYYALNQLFFNNPDVFPFLFTHNMPLDTMQLCVRAELREQEIASDWRIASHPSPAPLTKGLACEVIRTTSNAQAAVMCERGEVELCITTAQAAKIHGLATVHEFGSPIMVFFGGTTQHGMNVLLGR